MNRYSMGVDIGGTFVDTILFNRKTGSTVLEKALTTPNNPTEGVFEALSNHDVELSDVDTIVHGTTLGLNAVIERHGARAGVITNAGFRDVFELGRGNLPAEHMYNLHYQRPDLIVPRRRIATVQGRILVSGEVEVELDESQVAQAVRDLVDQHSVEAIAVIGLHSYINPNHEARIHSIIREIAPHICVSVSHQVAREFREYERTCTVILDAYVRPIFERYIDDLENQLAKKGFDGRFLIMRSSGGAMTARIAREKPLDSVLSGPAGGIVGASYLARELNIPRLLTMDFGGTSLDTCVVEDARPAVIHETRLQDLPVLIPAFDIRCIGAGGGSVAWLEEGMLRLGPQSAGADPGPICYGRGGTRPTLTDAALVLNFLQPEKFLGGQLPLDPDAALSGIRRLCETAGENDPVALAAGAFKVLAAQTEGAVREITIEQGRDPRDFTILAFGGAGPLIAPLIALEMGIPRTIIPNVPAVFSAWGMLMSDIATDQSQTFVSEVTEVLLESVETEFAQLEAKANLELKDQGVAESRRELFRFFEMRYVGQEHALKIPASREISLPQLRSYFDAAHEQRYGHCSEQPMEIVTLRVTGIGHHAKPQLHPTRHAGATLTATEGELSCPTRTAYCFYLSRLTEFSVVERNSIASSQTIQGPAIIDEGTSTTVIYTGQSCVADEYGQLVISTREAIADG